MLYNDYDFFNNNIAPFTFIKKSNFLRQTLTKKALSQWQITQDQDNLKINPKYMQF